jgi:hypothetical protein
MENLQFPAWQPIYIAAVSEANAQNLIHLVVSWGVVTTVLVFLLIYNSTLSTNDKLYLNKAEQQMMGAEQQALIGRMNLLSQPIIGLSVLSVILLMFSTAVWLWLGLNSF